MRESVRVRESVYVSVTLVIGAATSTAAGAVGFAARVVEGIDATVGAAQDGVKGGADAAAARRRRLPLAVRGDGVVRPYSRDDAVGR